MSSDTEHTKERTALPVTIAIKLKPDASTERAEERLKQVLGRDSIELRPLIESVPPKELDKLVERARRADPFYRDPADFSRWFKIVIRDAKDLDARIEEARRIEIVETAYVMRSLPHPVNPGDDPRYPNQGYLRAAPQGIDAVYAWGFAGGDGAGASFVDLESGWTLDHQDLAAAGITKISGQNIGDFTHGTSVLGVLRMVDNTVGGVGIAPQSSGRVVSRQRDPNGHPNVPDAIVDAVSKMSFGDVLLVEEQVMDPVKSSPPQFRPPEIEEATYQTIRLATALGIVVVEPACGNPNGVGTDLDGYAIAGQSILAPGLPGFRDSGAIMVGAADSANRSRLPFSNYGNRIDCFAWGNNIDTAATDDTGTDKIGYIPDRNRLGFGGASGAAAIVAGAALVTQGLAQAVVTQGLAGAGPGYRFGPRHLRELLKTNGTSSNSSADKIGTMPDLRALITGPELNLAPDIYLRDHVGDSGDPTSGMVSQSPDIIVKQASVAGPQLAFGAGSGTENNPALSDEVDRNDNFVYVRLLNRGGTVANNVKVDVYWSPPATLVTPNMWTLLGSTTVPSVPVAKVLTVSDAIRWPAGSIPASGHYCFIAIAGNAQDPTTDPAQFNDFGRYLTFVRNNNNVAWRNFNVLSDPESDGSYQLQFLVTGAFDRDRVFELETIAHLPTGSRAYLRMPGRLADLLRHDSKEIGNDAEVRPGASLHTAGTRRLGAVMLPAKSAEKCKLLVQIPEEERKRHSYEIAVRQLYRDVEVGRVTWRLGGSTRQ